VAFVSGHRVVLVEGGMEFSETVTLNTTNHAKPRVITNNDDRAEEGVSPTHVGGTSDWTVISGSMHRRASNW
jgi:hypothetical protein